jgi:peptide/nickel transport system substrate-binding protein
MRQRHITRRRAVKIATVITAVLSMRGATHAPRMLILMGLALPALVWPARAERFECGRRGGNIVFALPANVPNLDQHAQNSLVSRDVGINLFETLVTRDEAMRPLLQLAESVDVSKDAHAFTFKLRQGVRFHNGKTMTSADVLASFRRVQQIGVERSVFAAVDRFEALDAYTFVIKLSEPQPAFLEALSATTGIVIVPEENAGAPPGQLEPVGTGPFRLDRYMPDASVSLHRFEGYDADKRYDDVNGWGGYKVACLDGVTFRMAPDPAARTAALQTGEIQGSTNVPASQRRQLAANKSIRLMKLEHFALQSVVPNFSEPPTSNLKFRQAVQTVLDMNEILDAAFDGDYALNPSLQFPGTPYYSESGGSLYNQHDPLKARNLLKDAGYHGEKVVLLTTSSYPYHYNAALIVAEQLKSVGINAELLVLDLPAANQMSTTPTGWNLFFIGYVTYIASGGAATLRILASPNPVFMPPSGQSDPGFMAYFSTVEKGATLDERRSAFANAQARAMDQVMIIPFGAYALVSAVRTNVEHFVPNYYARLYNVWLRE